MINNKLLLIYNIRDFKVYGIWVLFTQWSFNTKVIMMTAEVSHDSAQAAAYGNFFVNTPLTVAMYDPHIYIFCTAVNKIKI